MNDQLLLLDGALATELERKGADLNDPLWSARLLPEQPGLLRQTHLDYLEAGADIICTATYQATFEGFQKKGYSRKKAESLLRLAVQLACEARDEYLAGPPATRRPLIAGSIGPYGAYLADGSEYSGHYNLNKKELMDFHRDRMEVLLDAGVDLLIFETFPSYIETEAVVELLEKMAPCPALFSFSCKDEKRISDGHLFKEAAGLASQCTQIKGVGINCVHPKLVSPLIESLNGSIRVPLMAYPNNGNIWDANHKCWIETGPPLQMEALWQQWIKQGVKIIGGCCNTSPDYIARLKEILVKPMSPHE